MNQPATEPRCRHRLPNPETAGATTWEALKQAAAQHPHLRPCPLHKGSQGTWNWINKKACEQCPEVFIK